jgi:hypothetical protein
LTGYLQISVTFIAASVADELLAAELRNLRNLRLS